MRRAFPSCRCESPSPDVIYDPVGGNPDRCGKCGGEITSYEPASTSANEQPHWGLLLVILFLAVCVILLSSVALATQGRNSGGQGGGSVGVRTTPTTYGPPSGK